MSTADKRMFYLMMSAVEGQEFAKLMGFQTPSEDVQQMEIMDVIRRWMLFARMGIFNEIDESSDWFATFLTTADKISSPPEEFRDALTVYGICMLNKVLESGLVGLVVDDGIYDQMKESDEYE